MSAVTKSISNHYDPFLRIEERFDRIEKLIEQQSRLHKSDPSEKKYIKIADAAAHVGLAVQTVYRLCSEEGSNFPHIKRHKRLLFLRDDLDRWLETGRKGQ